MAVAAAAVAALAVVMALAVLLMLFRGRQERRTAAQEAAKEDALERLSYRQLRRATGAFVARGKLGQGGFGTVFRGALSPPRCGGGGIGRPIAVKAMDATGSLQGEREFHNKITVAPHRCFPPPSPRFGIE